MQVKWVTKAVDEAKAQALQQQLGISIVLCRLLVQRGIETFEAAKKFFRPTLEDLHDPFLMKDMDKAVARLDEAISNGEKILIYGDYDVDGTTSVALVYLFLKDFYPDIDYYIPNRYKEGYGISYTGIDFAKENGFTLIIALDCGIKSINEIKYATEKGIDFIIGDHHLPGDEIPAAVAVLDPKRDDCSYPFKELSGCGIGFKLMHALVKHFDIPEEKLFNLIGLTAVSIACDIVPVTGENRILTHYGIKNINENPLPGLRSLLEISGITKDVSVTDLVFYVGPRINAAGRMDDARKAVKLLISGEEDNSVEHATLLHKHNTTRKVIDAQITEQALEMIRINPEEANKKTTVLFSEDWHKGVIGIVASRLIETYYRPTIIFTQSEEYLAGSARSVAGFDIHEAIKECSDLLEKFGGHKYAAGLSLKKENYELFRQRFEEVVAATIPDECLIPEIAIDTEIELNDIKGSFFKILQQFAPFGPHNMKPVFYTRNVSDTGWGKVVGENHLKLRIKTSGSQPFNAIAFEKGIYLPKINGKPFEVCYTIEENEFRGVTNIQLNVKDLKI